jgi:hypothetical protein
MSGSTPHAVNQAQTITSSQSWTAGLGLTNAVINTQKKTKERGKSVPCVSGFSKEKQTMITQKKVATQPLLDVSQQ